ncbi:GNAT family N-acetyltransferase [Streptomyces sp. NBC_00237]|uniref:GNAT family N-acetyltransferase n=1 Tax=Streptomyces sp. NBC_00237 TaxID=2975687 RepID=UPI0022543969|nr:GNAT family N-acetyltransferase [Streptomyces sp. NBC_00237]MCX5206572.1 GNAT family N-acetyltransferase [Streptomyces sp. NBC_00237]
MDSARIRRMHALDLPSAEQASNITFLEGDRRSRRVSDPEPEPRTPAESALWIERMGHFLATDPEGCWVAVEDASDDNDTERVIGFALSQNRGPLWLLITYGVLPGRQGKGIGSRLMDAVLAHAGGRRGMFISTVHPGATRRYWQAGFTLQPLMGLTGTVDRSTLPAITGLRDGTPDDIEWMDRLDTELRGAGHGGPDHLHMQRTMRLTVAENPRTPGYVYTENGRPNLLAAHHPDTASTLLWEALAQAPASPVNVPSSITAANQWALDVGLTARLDLYQDGYLALRGLDAPAPYIPSGRFL